MEKIERVIKEIECEKARAAWRAANGLDRLYCMAEVRALGHCLDMLTDAALVAGSRDRLWLALGAMKTRADHGPSGQGWTYDGPGTAGAKLGYQLAFEVLRDYLVDTELERRVNGGGDGSEA